MTPTDPIEFPGETASNKARVSLSSTEPIAQRTYTPTQAVFQKSAGVFHYTPEGRRLYDFSSGVLVANLGHNPVRWLRRFQNYMQWPSQFPEVDASTTDLAANHVQQTNGRQREHHQQFNARQSMCPSAFTDDGYLLATTLTAYNAVTPIETLATERLLTNLRAAKGGERLEQVLWAASGSEAVHKALWAALRRDPKRNIILATRFGFHGKKGLANAVTGSETDLDRDPRVRFIAFPMCEISDIETADGREINWCLYEDELTSLRKLFGKRLTAIITEPYLGGGGSYHPPAEYLQRLQQFCRDNDMLFVLDEVQSNFGRTGPMYAFEKYGLQPDLVVLGKGLGNGVPVAAVAGPKSLFSHLKYGEASDTWSANPLSCAAVVATLDEFEQTNVLQAAAAVTPIIISGLQRLKKTGLVKAIRGEGMVFGIECGEYAGLSSHEVAVAIVRAAYLGEDFVRERSAVTSLHRQVTENSGVQRNGATHAATAYESTAHNQSANGTIVPNAAAHDGIHFLGPLAGRVLRVSPPLTITAAQATAAFDLLFRVTTALAEELRLAAQPAVQSATRTI